MDNEVMLVSIFSLIIIVMSFFLGFRTTPDTLSGESYFTMVDSIVYNPSGSDQLSLHYCDNDLDGYYSIYPSECRICTDCRDEPGLDCNDYNRWANPLEKENCRDKIDNDCNGLIDDMDPRCD